MNIFCMMEVTIMSILYFVIVFYGYITNFVPVMMLLALGELNVLVNFNKK